MAAGWDVFWLLVACGSAHVTTEQLVGPGSAAAPSSVSLPGIVVLLVALAFSFMEVAAGWTPGKAIMRLRIRALYTARSAAIGQRAIRWAFKTMPLWLLLAAWTLEEARRTYGLSLGSARIPRRLTEFAGVSLAMVTGVFAVTIGRRRQTLYDKLSNTIVVSVRPGAAEVEPPGGFEPVVSARHGIVQKGE